MEASSSSTRVLWHSDITCVIYPASSIALNHSRALQTKTQSPFKKT